MIVLLTNNCDAEGGQIRVFLQSGVQNSLHEQQRYLYFA